MKWEYKILHGFSLGSGLADLNGLGALWWEVCGVLGSGFSAALLLKRQVQSAATP
jgi:hypothetical protein